MSVQDPTKRDESHPEAAMRAHGWTQSLFTELAAEFQRLSYLHIADIVKQLGMTFSVPLSDIAKEELLRSIAREWTPQHVREQIQRVRGMVLTTLPSRRTRIAQPQGVQRQSYGAQQSNTSVKGHGKRPMRRY